MEYLLLLLFLPHFCVGQSEDEISETNRAKRWLDWYNHPAEQLNYENNLAHWKYNTNVTDHNQQIANEADASLALFQQQAALNASRFNLTRIRDPIVKRHLIKLSKVGIKLDEEDHLVFSSLTGGMVAVYSTSTVCSMNSNGAMDCSKRWSLNELSEIMSESRDYELLKYAWEAWRNASGRIVRDQYRAYVALSNRGARADGFKDTGAWWRSWYEDEDLEKNLERIWYQVLPLYEQLYSYVRKILRDRIYGTEKIKNVLPAHVLGNMWAQEWTSLFNSTVPFPNKQSVDVTNSMLAQNYTPLRMLRKSDEFFQSLGLIPMPSSFYRNSMIEKPKDGQVVCHPSAWDFNNRVDFRIKMCSRVNMEDFITMHHEMGHTQYQLQYAHLAHTFRDGANPGFHEAIGDTISLSASTPKHLQVLGLLDNVPDDEQDINFLYKTALEKIALLPFTYLIDLWRWKIFTGDLTFDRWNEAYWQLRFKYQGLKPPAPRRRDDFDPGSKFHIVYNAAYIRYFVAQILQMQFYQAMCGAANHTGPLHKCDFYQNKQAGETLAKVMRMGCSKPWQDILKTITGQSTMNAQSLIDYFQPLIDWLKVQNNGECFGWGYKWPDDVMRNLSPNRCPPD